MSAPFSPPVPKVSLILPPSSASAVMTGVFGPKMLRRLVSVTRFMVLAGAESASRYTSTRFVSRSPDAGV